MLYAWTSRRNTREIYTEGVRVFAVSVSAVYLERDAPLQAVKAAHRHIGKRIVSEQNVWIAAAATII
jgi:hypothetical protein